ncbi:MAG: hypothetical protein B7Z55_09255 [Planctomycetales bacterium 12-60-4]|nr:MAG: hypothetical protein B7Z55_09255 [Planctomycetales bacterium 12-60-4]
MKPTGHTPSAHAYRLRKRRADEEVIPRHTQQGRDRVAGGVHRNRWVQLGVGVAVSLACLWWSVSGVLKEKDALERIQAAFANANYATLPLLWLGVVTFYLLKAWRWRLLLQPIGNFHTLRDCLPPTMVGFAFNNLLPAHLGDFVRVFLFARQHRVNATAVLSSAVLERVFDVMAILCYLGLGLAMVPGMPNGVRDTAIVVAGLAAVFVVSAIVYLFWTEPFVRFVEGVLARLPFIPAGLRTKICSMLEAGADGLRSLHNPTLVLGIMASSLAQWAINGLQMHIALWSFGVEVSPLVSCILLGVTAFGVTVPSSPGFFGVIQACFMLVLTLFCKDQAAIFGASIYFHLSQYIPVTLVGLLFFSLTGMRLADVEAQAEKRDVAAAPVG